MEYYVPCSISARGPRAGRGWVNASGKWTAPEDRRSSSGRRRRIRASQYGTWAPLRIERRFPAVRVIPAQFGSTCYEDTKKGKREKCCHTPPPSSHNFSSHLFIHRGRTVVLHGVQGRGGGEGDSSSRLTIQQSSWAKSRKAAHRPSGKT